MLRLAGVRACVRCSSNINALLTGWRNGTIDNSTHHVGRLSVRCDRVAGDTLHCIQRPPMNLTPRRCSPAHTRALRHGSRCHGTDSCKLTHYYVCTRASADVRFDNDSWPCPLASARLADELACARRRPEFITHKREHLLAGRGVATVRDGSDDGDEDTSASLLDGRRLCLMRARSSGVCVCGFYLGVFFFVCASVTRLRALDDGI